MGAWGCTDCGDGCPWVMGRVRTPPILLGMYVCRVGRG